MSNNAALKRANSARCKKLLKEFLDNSGIFHTKLTAITVDTASWPADHFAVQAGLSSYVFVMIHGGISQLEFQQAQLFAHQHGFGAAKWD